LIFVSRDGDNYGEFYLQTTRILGDDSFMSLYDETYV